MNSVTLVGRIARAVDLQKTQSGMSIVKNALACDRGRDRGTDFVPVTFFKDTAELVSKFVHKGDRIGVEGKIRVETRENQDGKRTFIDVVVDRVEFLGGGQRTEAHYVTPEDSYNASTNSFEIPQGENRGQDEVDIVPDDLPF